MSLQVRRTTPFTAEDYEQVRAYATRNTPEHDALAQVTPVPLREGSEGATLRALTLLGMAYVRERQRETEALAQAYDELAAERATALPQVAARRMNMARRANRR